MIPVVSVKMITYKHEAYITQAIEGVLMQETNFEYDLIIADDCSPDKTEEIVKNIIATHPKGHIIKYFRHEKNIGMIPNGLFAIQQCQGKYFALCEGDDYWTDPYKLQKQVDFLEGNEEYVFSMGKVKVLKHTSGEIFYKEDKRINPSSNETYILKDYLKGHFSQTSSFLFKNTKTSFPTWFSQVYAGDQTLVVLITGLHGKIKYHNDFFSVYRWHEKGVTNLHSNNFINNQFIKTLGYWHLYLNKEYSFLFFLLKLKYRIEIKKDTAKNRFTRKFYKIILSQINKFIIFL